MNSPADAIFFAVICALTLAGVWRELPAQYVFTVTGVMYGISAVALWLFNESHWWLPLIVLNSRGVSRLILSKFRERGYYGWWVIGFTCALSSVPVPLWRTALLAFIMQIVSLPWLVKRRPGTDAPSYFAVINWLLLSAWILIAT